MNKELLAHILECDSEDLKLLNDIRYDVYKIIENIPKSELTLKRILEEVITLGNKALHKEWEKSKKSILRDITNELSEIGNDLIKNGYDPSDDAVFLAWERDKEFLMNDADEIINKGIQIEFNFSATHLYLKNASFFENYLCRWYSICKDIGFAPITDSER